MKLQFPENIFYDLEFGVMEITPEMEKRLDDVLKKLSKREDDVLRLRYECGDTLAEIAEELHIQRSKVITAKDNGLKYVKTFKKYICTGKDDSIEEEEFSSLREQIEEAKRQLNVIKEKTRIYEEKLSVYYQMNLEEMAKVQTILTSMMEGNPSFSSSGETLPKDFSAEDLCIPKVQEESFPFGDGIALNVLYEKGYVPARPVNSLMRSGVINFGTLKKVTRADLDRMKGMGKKTRTELMDFLNGLGIKVPVKAKDPGDTLILLDDYPGTSSFLYSNGIHTYRELLSFVKKNPVDVKYEKVIFMCKDVCGKYRELLKKGD